MHRLKPLIGRKVDSIEYGRSHLVEVLPKVQSAQHTHLAGKEKLVSAVFVNLRLLPRISLYTPLQSMTSLPALSRDKWAFYRTRLFGKIWA
jgi:hypothetical protein